MAEATRHHFSSSATLQYITIYSCPSLIFFSQSVRRSSLLPYELCYKISKTHKVFRLSTLLSSISEIKIDNRHPAEDLPPAGAGYIILKAAGGSAAHGFCWTCGSLYDFLVPGHDQRNVGIDKNRCRYCRVGRCRSSSPLHKPFAAASRPPGCHPRCCLVSHPAAWLTQSAGGTLLASRRQSAFLPFHQT